MQHDGCLQRRKVAMIRSCSSEKPFPCYFPIVTKQSNLIVSLNIMSIEGISSCSHFQLCFEVWYIWISESPSEFWCEFFGEFSRQLFGDDAQYLSKDEPNIKFLLLRYNYRFQSPKRTNDEDRSTKACARLKSFSY